MQRLVKERMTVKINQKALDEMIVNTRIPSVAFYIISGALLNDPEIEDDFKIEVLSKYYDFLIENMDYKTSEWVQNYQEAFLKKIKLDRMEEKVNECI